MKIQNILAKLGRAEKEPKIGSHSCGKAIGRHTIFEQIQVDGQICYAVWETRKRRFQCLKQIEDDTHVYYPYCKIPFKLPSEPEDYEDEKSLWNDVYECVKKHWDYPDPRAYHVLTAWIHATWLRELWLATPYLFFLGALETGKTRGLEILAELSMRGWLALYVTPANLYRPLEQWRPTLLLDETETYGSKSEITALLNGSYRKGQLVPRQVEGLNGKFKTEFFDCYGFKALAGTKSLADTLESRSIRLKMSRATRKLRLFIDRKQTAELRSQLLMYRFKRLGEIVSKVSNLEEGYERFGDKLQSSRLAELFFPLVFVAPTNDIRNQIFSFAIDLDRERWEELTASKEAVVLTAVIRTYQDGKHDRGRIKVKDVAETLNEQLPVKEQYSSRKVSGIAKELGFKKSLLHGLTVIHWDERLIERLKTDPRYSACFEASPPSENLTYPTFSPEKTLDWNEVFPTTTTKEAKTTNVR